jgi:hypothetical protein
MKDAQNADDASPMPRYHQVRHQAKYGNNCMPKIAHTAHDMISGMTPVLRPGDFVFVTTNDANLAASLSSGSVSTFREKEGLSLLIPVELAERSSLTVELPMRCITLNVFSSLDGVGLSAAVASALGDNNIPCNMIAAFHHDHVFVPSEMAAHAMEVLIDLQNQAAKPAWRGTRQSCHANQPFHLTSQFNNHATRRQRILSIMGDHQHWQPARFGAVKHHLADLGAQRCVKSRKRFVQQQSARFR